MNEQTTKPKFKLIHKEDSNIFESEVNKLMQNDDIVLLGQPVVEPTNKGFMMHCFYVTREEYLRDLKARQSAKNETVTSDSTSTVKTPSRKEPRRKTILHES